MAVEMMSAFSTSETVALEKRVDIEDVAQLVDLGFDERYDLDKCVRWIKENDLTKICLQFPDGLLKDSAEVALCLERRTGQRIYILADTSYGSCCVDEVAAQHVDADAIIHFGHSCLSATRRLPVLYVFDKYSLDMVHFLSSFRSQFLCRESRILLMYDVGYSHVIVEVATKLALEYHNLVVSKLALSSSDTEEGEQKMLGRRFSIQEGTKLEDYTVLFIGRDGHTLSNIVLASPETLAYIYDPTQREGVMIYEGTRSKFLRRRLYLIEKVKDANTLGVLIGTLGVVDYLSAVERIKLLAKSQGKKCYIISVGKPNVAKLANFSEIDVFVLVACPENSLMDAKDFYHPIVTLYDVEIACNPQRIFQLNYVLEFQNLLPGGSRYVELSEEEQQEQSLDVSLITGKIRGRPENSAAPSTAVATKGDLELATLGTTGSNYLASRTWHGLEVRLGQDDVMPAEKGLCGLPRGYQSEPDPKPQS